MVMDFRVQDPAWLRTLKPGQKIGFEIIEGSAGEYVIARIDSGPREQAEVPPSASGQGVAAVIGKVIEWSVRHVFLVLIGVFALVSLGAYSVVRKLHRRHPRPFRHAGHHLHRIPRSSAPGGGGSGDLSAHYRHAERTENRGGAPALSNFGVSFICADY